MSEEAPPTEGGPAPQDRTQDQTQDQSQSMSTGPTQSQSQTQSTLSPSQVQTQSQSQGKSSSSGSSGSSGTLSSMDTIPVTLPSVPEEPEPDHPQPWGRLLPMLQGFRALDLVQDSYEVGRDRKADYSLGTIGEKALIYSKRHFKIYKEGSEAFVEDLSNNGTFVDGLLIGFKRKTPLINNAVISLSYEKNRVFVFTDLSGETSALPDALQQKYALTKTIGTGVCGEVKLAFERETMKKFAVKIINKGNFKSEGTATRNAETEIEILQRIDHPCLMKTKDFYQTDESYFIVLELMEGGELYFRVKSKKQIPEAMAKFYFYQMLLAVQVRTGPGPDQDRTRTGPGPDQDRTRTGPGPDQDWTRTRAVFNSVCVQYLHSQGIIHRDLKPENVLLSSQEDYCLIKVTDFNQSRILEEAALMKTLCGTPSYLAPEVLMSPATEGYGLSVDSWSLGVLLFVCLGGYPPFHEQFGSSVREQILRGSYTMLSKQWDHISAPAKDLVMKLLVVDPSQRLNIEDALAHAWLQDEEMQQKVHRLMYPEPPDAPEPSMSALSSALSSSTRSSSSTSGISSASTRSSSSAAPPAEASSRKRTRSGSDRESGRTKKRK